MNKMRILVFGAALALYLGYSALHVQAQITDPIEVSALQAIRRSLKDPTKRLKNWNRGDPCTSNWTGVFCFNMTEKDGYLHVRQLQLLNMNLSGSLSPELGQLSFLEILDFMWNKISGSIPKELGNIKTLVLMLLNGNQLTGPLPQELGYLPNLDRFQIDENQISGPIPESFANLNKTKHFHMNNNSISGQIPPVLSRLPILAHFLLDNNKLSGYLPPELSEMPQLQILQLDNNNFDDGTIPASYGNMPKLFKLSLRNCNLQGPVPDLSRISNLSYVDLSWNQLNGPIPSNKLTDNITTIILSNNNLSGPIPANFSGLPRLQKLSLENNSLNGSVPSTIWESRTFNATERLLLDFQNNQLSDVLGSIEPPANVTFRLRGNPVCTANLVNIAQFCGSKNVSEEEAVSSTASPAHCYNQSCPEDYEYVPESPVPCFCAAPLRVGFRLKSPALSNFLPYETRFKRILASALDLDPYQLSVDSFIWENGPRLRMYLKLFPKFINRTHTFNESEIRRIRKLFVEWKISVGGFFGPYELLNFSLLRPYLEEVDLDFSKSGLSKGAIAGIVLAAVAGAVTVSVVVSILITRRYMKKYHTASRKRLVSKISIKIDGVKAFIFKEMALATDNFSISSQVGQGGYGKVYKGTLADGTVVAIKRALEESLQGEREFFTEIELLSRLHHRNLVSLVGYCDDEGEQMLVYEFMPNGNLRDHLSVKSKEPLSFAMRLQIALGSAKGILYLHTEADPPIFHRDIKASNILLDSRFTAKVADFGLSRLAPVPDMEGTVPGHVSTVVKGTPGYLDPEYFLTHKLTDKSDVYSLGVVFLELLTGMQPILHGKNIVREVNLAYQVGKMFSVIDGRMGSYPSECVAKFVTLALKCSQDETETRPSMAEVVRELENIWLMMPESDTTTSESVISNPTTSTPPAPPLSSSSSSVTKNPYWSSDVSSSNLVSGVIPTITPR